MQAALLAHDEIDEWDDELVIAGRELAEDQPNDWVLEGWYPRRPDKAQKAALANLFDSARPTIAIEKLEDQDWIKLSQQGTPPISAGPFYVRTPGHKLDPQAINFLIPAALAFWNGTASDYCWMPRDARPVEAQGHSCAQCRRYRYRNRVARLCIFGALAEMPVLRLLI